MVTFIKSVYQHGRQQLHAEVFLQACLNHSGYFSLNHIGYKSAVLMFIEIHPPGVSLAASCTFYWLMKVTLKTKVRTRFYLIEESLRELLETLGTHKALLVVKFPITVHYLLSRGKTALAALAHCVGQSVGHIAGKKNISESGSEFTYITGKKLPGLCQDAPTPISKHLSHRFSRVSPVMKTAGTCNQYKQKAEERRENVMQEAISLWKHM